MPPNTALAAALRAERWIDSTRIDTPSGHAWPITADSEHVALSLYQGTPGIVIFYLELHGLTKESRYLDIAVHGADDLLSRLGDTDSLTVGLYQGLSGLSFCLSEVARASGDDAYRKQAQRCLGQLFERAIARGAGAGFIEPIPFADAFGVSGETEVWDVSRGGAGTGLSLLYAHREGLHDGALDLATRLGDRLLEVSAATTSGRQWQMMQEDVDWTAPNFSHGTAGIAYFLARLSAATSQSRFLDAALEGARHLQSIATVDGKGHLIYHNARSRERLFYFAWCHGPTGTARLYFQLANLTSEPEWSQWLESIGVGLLRSGVPEERQRGFWNNVSQCCGDAGVGEIALDLYGITHQERFLELARRVGTSLNKHATTREGASCWVQAENRIQPDHVEAQTGYMQGASGIGSYYLRLHAIESGLPNPKIRFPDSPFGQPSQRNW